MLRAKFSTLRHILEDLGFTMQANEKRVRFDHAPSKTWFLYPPHEDDKEVSPADLVAARYMLDMKGLLPRDEFEEQLRQRLVAG
jgi:hypothetical protein